MTLGLSMTFRYPHIYYHNNRSTVLSQPFNKMCECGPCGSEGMYSNENHRIHIVFPGTYTQI